MANPDMVDKNRAELIALIGREQYEQFERAINEEPAPGMLERFRNTLRGFFQREQARQEGGQKYRKISQKRINRRIKKRKSKKKRRKRRNIHN